MSDDSHRQHYLRDPALAPIEARLRDLEARTYPDDLERHLADLEAAADRTQETAQRTARLVDGFEEELAKLGRRVFDLERQNRRLRESLLSAGENR